MAKYDGPSFYKQSHPKVKPIKKKKKVKQSKYSLPKKVKTRKDWQNEAHDYMETPSLTTTRFRSTKLPNSLEPLKQWEKTKKNEKLIDQIRTRLQKDKTDYLLFEEYMVEDLKPKAKPKPKPKSKATVVKEEMTSALNKPNSGLHRSLSKIIAEDQEALKNGKNNLNSLFSEDK